MSTRRHFIGAALALTGLLASGLPALAQAGYPDKPITLVVAYGAGGPTDAIARLFADKLAAQLGQQIIVENRTGAGGAVGAEYVQKAAPDGYTLTVMTTGIIPLPLTYKAVSFDPVRDFTPISYWTEGPLVLYANKDMPFNTFAEFLDYAKAHPGELNFAGHGSSLDLDVAVMMKMAGIDLSVVTYQGAAGAMTAVVSGESDVAIDQTSSAQSFIKSGEVKPLGMVSGAAWPAMPELPVVSETLIPGYKAAPGWFGLAGPAGLPDDVVSRLRDASIAVTKDPDIIKTLTEQGLIVGDGTTEALSQHIADSYAGFKAGAELTNFQPQ